MTFVEVRIFQFYFKLRPKSKQLHIPIEQINKPKLYTKVTNRTGKSKIVYLCNKYRYLNIQQSIIYQSNKTNLYIQPNKAQVYIRKLLGKQKKQFDIPLV